MEKPSGRHRKPVRGWAHQVRWLLGVVLAALLCSAVDSRQVRQSLQPPRVDALQGARPALRNRTAAAGTDRPRPRSAPLAARDDRPVSDEPVLMPRPRLPHPLEQGWCVDDDGVRGVRPYLFHGTSKVGPRPPEPTAQAEPGELDELASLVRTWLSMAT